MKSKYTILIDMDDTIEDLVPSWVDYLNMKYGYNKSLSDITDWSMKLNFPDLTEEQIGEPLSDRIFWMSVTPKPGAVEYIKKLIDDGYKIKIVTASYYNTIAFKIEEVLFKYFPYLTWSDVIVTYDKDLIKGTCLIDDGFHNLLGGTWDKILFDAPHNRKYDETKFNMIRVFNWEAIYEYITERYK